MMTVRRVIPAAVALCAYLAAVYLAGEGAGLHLPQSELTAASLAQRLRTLDRPALLAMAERARALARPQAAARVADEIERLVQPKGADRA